MPGSDLRRADPSPVPGPITQRRLARGRGGATIRAVAATAALLAVPASCASLVGFEDDYQVQPATGPSSGAQGGDGGAASSGGAGGTGAATTGGSGGAPAACAHDVCVGGPKLEDGCSQCVTDVCEADPYCCGDMGGEWDDACVYGANDLCDLDCCGDGSCLGTDTCTNCLSDCGCACPHSVCTTGAALDRDACHDEACRQLVCAQMPACCTHAYSWTKSCSDAKATICADDDSCVDKVCNSEASCCTDSWTNQCVTIAKNLCDVTCECETPLCVVGAQFEDLTAGCDPCAEAVCAFDPACCTAGWGPFCVAHASKICGLDC
jgi:hypothetical protein